MGLYFQGVAWLSKGMTPDNVARARGFFDRALTADPDNVDALILSANVDMVEGIILFVKDPVLALAAAETKLTRAVSLITDHASAHMCLGGIYTLTKRAARGMAECEHALALDHNLAHAHAWIGYGKIYVGRAEETEAHILKALRLSPRDIMVYVWMTAAGTANLHLGSWEQAVAWFQRSMKRIEVIRLRILGWPPASPSLPGSMRQTPPSRPALRSTQTSPPPAPAPPGRRLATTRRILRG